MNRAAALAALTLLASCDGRSDARAAPPAEAARPAVPETVSTCLLGYRDTGGPIANCNRAIVAGGVPASLVALVYNARGEGYCHEGRYGQGIADQTQAIALAPKFPQAWADRAYCHLREGDLTAVADDFAGAIAARLRERDASALPGVPQVVSDCLASRRGPACTSAIASGGLSHAMLALAYNARGLGNCASAKYALAIADQNRAIALAPDFPQAFVDRAACHEGLNDINAALADYDAAIALAPNVPGYLIERGDLRNWRGRHDLALADYAKARRLAPQFNRSLNGTGKTLFAMGRFAEAADDIAEVMRGSPGNPYLTLWLHIARARAHQPDAVEFAANTKKLDLTAWPGPLFGLFAGTMTRDQALTATVRYPGVGRQSECDVAIFVAQQRIIAGDTAGARDPLLEAVNVCPTDDTLYPVLISWADLKRIDPKAAAQGPW